MDQPNLQVNSIKVSHSQTFDTAGKAATNTHVSFMVGDHGPFFLDYAPGKGTTDQIKSDIQAQKAALTDLHSLEGV